MAAPDAGPDSDHWRGLPAPRVPPFAETDTPAWAKPVLAGARRVIGGPTPNIIATLARHPRLFAPWMAFASQLMPQGRLPRRDTELVILRVAWNARSFYEWNHHTRIGAKAGLGADEIERVAEGPDAEGWSEREQALLRATDELHAERAIGEETWSTLAAHLGETELIELCMLVGHYEMLAMTIASLGIQPER